jgi:hypothetical protein
LITLAEPGQKVQKLPQRLTNLGATSDLLQIRAQGSQRAFDEF